MQVSIYVPGARFLGEGLTGTITDRSYSSNVIVHALHYSIHTLDTSRKSLLHHIMYLAGSAKEPGYLHRYIPLLCPSGVQHSPVHRHDNNNTKSRRRVFCTAQNKVRPAQCDTSSPSCCHLRARAVKANTYNYSRCGELDQIHQWI